MREIAGRPGGVGLGLRWEFLDEIVEGPQLNLGFLEVSPENYMRRGGYYPAALERLADRYAFVTHGLTMSLGAVDDPPAQYLRELKGEIQRLNSPWHSDHLCFSTSGAQVLHELLPLKLCEENVVRVADRLQRVQDAVGVPMAMENVTWYVHPGQVELPEAEFIQRIVQQSGAGLLLDVNNVYVNAQNHGFDPYAFMVELPLDRVVEIHVAGHTRTDSGLILDTHGTPVCDPVYELLRFTLERTGPVPVLLERDNDVPALVDLLSEVAQVQTVFDEATRVWEKRHAASA
ncbi:MAG TPA: DUF692 domain-containing protein [Polyangiaceae bacterium]|nr:DUF692 domain-containing protein [Polyangiaceae bacterium]